MSDLEGGEASDSELAETQPDQTEAAGGEPSLDQQTQALGRTLKHVADGDPAGTPGVHTVAVFREWLAVAGPVSDKPHYFADVAENYDAEANTNRDLFLLFDMLAPYLDIEPEAAPERTFIGLPLI